VGLLYSSHKSFLDCRTVGLEQSTSLAVHMFPILEITCSIAKAGRGLTWFRAWRDLLGDLVCSPIVTLSPSLSVLRPRIHNPVSPRHNPVFFLSWLTMQSFRVVKNKPRKSSKPLKNKSDQRTELSDAIESDEGNKAMVACTKCVENNAVCYYDREQSMSCAECIRHQRTCDGTFALEEFRKVGEEKKRLQAQYREERRKVVALRKALVEAESREVDLQDSIAEVEEISSRMLRREMQVLGVMGSLDSEKEVALAEPEFVWEGAPVAVAGGWDDAWLGSPSGDLVTMGEAARPGSVGGS
jgi:hypothetical protein